jgi:hypothetical protein
LDPQTAAAAPSPAVAAPPSFWRAATLTLLSAAACVSLAAQQPTSRPEEAAQFALIVNNDDSFTHNLNVKLAAAALEHLGYRPENILVIAHGSSQDLELPAAVRRGPASRQGLAEALRYLKSALRPHDLLLVYLTGDGTRAFGRSIVVLQGGHVTAPAFAHSLGELPFARLILIADQCYSGGFVSAVTGVGRDVVAVSSADEHHQIRCEPFVRTLWDAAVGGQETGGAAGASRNVSVEEAFRAGAANLAKGEPTAAPQYAASGRCKGHENFFSLPPL